MGPLTSSSGSLATYDDDNDDQDRTVMPGTRGAVDPKRDTDMSLVVSRNVRSLLFLSPIQAPPLTPACHVPCICAALVLWLLYVSPLSLTLPYTTPHCLTIPKHCPSQPAVTSVSPAAHCGTSTASPYLSSSLLFSHCLGNPGHCLGNPGHCLGNPGHCLGNPGWLCQPHCGTVPDYKRPEPFTCISTVFSWFQS